VSAEHLPIDDRVAERLPARRKGNLQAAARAAHRIGFRYLSWLYLLEAEFKRLARRPGGHHAKA
jgi:hypothetical protein